MIQSIVIVTDPLASFPSKSQTIDVLFKNNTFLWIIFQINK